MTSIQVGDEVREAAYRWSGVNPRGEQVQGRMTLTPDGLAAVVEDRYRQGWRSLTVHAGDGPVPPSPAEQNPVATIGPHPETGKRTWRARDVATAKTTDDATVPAPGTPCPRGCTLEWPRHKEPELLRANEDGEVSCPTCWECFGIVDAEAGTPALREGEQ